MCRHHDHHRDWGHHEGPHHHHHEDWGRRDRGPDWDRGPREHRDPHHHHCGPDCWREGHEQPGPFGFRRQFVSDREILDALKDYLKELENEAQGVREAIAEIEEEMEEGAGDEK